MVEENRLLEIPHSCGFNHLALHVHVILSAPFPSTLNSSPALASTVSNPMAPVLGTTRIFVFVLWIAVVFNAFKPCLVSPSETHWPRTHAGTRPVGILDILASFWAPSHPPCVIIH